MITYQTHIIPFSKEFILVKLEDIDVQKIDAFVNKIIERKKKESHHFIDKNSHYKRYYTGILGELALEKFFGINGIVDWSIGDSKDYHVPDLKKLGLNIGIKTVEYGAFPVIFKKNYSNEIILIRWKDKHVYICGLATQDVLNKFQSEDLILDKKLKIKGTKTGFYGFEHLKKFSSLEELKRQII
jgi:hypothetical protein